MRRPDDEPVCSERAASPGLLLAGELRHLNIFLITSPSPLLSLIPIFLHLPSRINNVLCFAIEQERVSLRASLRHPSAIDRLQWLPLLLNRKDAGTFLLPMAVKALLTCATTELEGDLRCEASWRDREDQEAPKVRFPSPPSSPQRRIDIIIGSMATRSSARSPLTKSTAALAASSRLFGR